MILLYCVALICNRVLLQRISNILTAPPSITDKDYRRMRKLVSTMKGPREIYESNLIMQKNKEFFRELKKVGPYYNAKDWENDYQHQVIHQNIICFFLFSFLFICHRFRVM